MTASAVEVPPPSPVGTQFDGAYENWFPAPSWGFDTPTLLTTYTPESVRPCMNGTLREWQGENGAFLRVAWVGCASEFDAWEYNKSFWRASSDVRENDPEFASTLGGGANWIEGDEPSGGILGGWVQGTYVLAVALHCPSESTGTCAESFDAIAADLAQVQAGVPASNNPATNLVTPAEISQILIQLPLAVWLFFIAPGRLISRLRSPQRLLHPDGARVRDVGPLVRRDMWVLRGKRTLAWTAIVFALASLGSWQEGSRVRAALLGVVAVALLVVSRKIRRALPPPRRQQTRWRSPAAVVGQLLGALGHVVAAMALFGYFVIATVGLATSHMPIATVNRRIDELLSSHLFFDQARGAVIGVAAVLQEYDSFELALLLYTIPALAAAYLLGRLGRRFAVVGARQAIERDARRPVLFLRGFDEDRRTIPARFLRRGPLEWLSPVRTVRFEEVVARTLQNYGPVIAVSPPGTRIPKLGAARLSLPHDDWKDRVAELAHSASFIVVSATPSTVHHGLAWEMDLVGRQETPRVVLVRGPWPPTQVEKRWAAFAEAVRTVPLLGAIDPKVVQPGVQAMVNFGDSGWVGFGSRRWSDWSYSGALRAAVETASPHWFRGAQATLTEGSESVAD